MMQLNLKKKIAAFTTIFILLIIASLLTSIWGLQKIHFAKVEAEIAHKMYDSFQELRILWEMSLMGPHDYIIHKGQHEIEVFEQDYKRLLDKEIALVNLIVKNEMKRSPGFNIILKSLINGKEIYGYIAYDKSKIIFSSLNDQSYRSICLALKIE